MTLARRIIPVLLAHEGHLVKGTGFSDHRVSGSVQQATEIYQARGVDELIVLDIAATARGGPDIEAMRKLTDICYMPVTVGGGINTVDHARALLANGADKVAVGNAFIDKPTLVSAIADKFGSQAVSVVINYRRLTRDVVSLADRAEKHGAGEVILNNITRDGHLTGYDLATIKAVSTLLSIPVVPCGGCGNYKHMHLALTNGASAVAAGAMFLWTEATPQGAAQYLASKGWSVRV